MAAGQLIKEEIDEMPAALRRLTKGGQTIGEDRKKPCFVENKVFYMENVFN